MTATPEVPAHRNNRRRLSVLAATTAAVAVLSIGAYSRLATPHDASPSDISCEDENLSIFRRSAPNRPAGEFTLNPRGPSLRQDVALEIQIEANDDRLPLIARVRRVLSDGAPPTLVGQQLGIVYGRCVRRAAIGESGIIVGILIDEHTSRPSIQPKP